MRQAAARGALTALRLGHQAQLRVLVLQGGASKPWSVGWSRGSGPTDAVTASAPVSVKSVWQIHGS